MNIVNRFKSELTSIEESLKAKRIVIVSGGFSEEREASIESGESVYEELKRHSFNLFILDPAKQDITRVLDSKKDIVFNCLHGEFGESGHLSAILDYLKIPYTFSDLYTSVVCMDKLYFKSIVKKIGFNCPLDNYDIGFCDLLKSNILIHKKIRGGGSIGMNICEKNIELKTGYFAEEFINGKILTMGILEENGEYEALDVIEIDLKYGLFYDNEAKYDSNQCNYSKYSGKRRSLIQESSVILFNFLHIKSCGRIDFIEDANGDIFFLEINTVPGLYAGSNLAFSAKCAGLSFYELLIFILKNHRYKIL